MASREVKAIITADASNFQKGVGKATQSSTSLEKALGKLGPVGKVLNSVLNNLGLGGITAGAGIVGGVAAATALAAKFAEDAVDKYVQLGAAIRSYSLVTGQSAEDSSRQVEAFQELGVASDAAQTGMFRLAKTAEETPAKLEKLGVAIAKNSDGSLNLSATLINVMNAYQGTTDAGQRAAIVFAAFGKGGQAMIPILETNIAQLQRLESQVAKVYTAADLQRVRDYQIAQKELKQSQDELGLSIGEKLLPIQKAQIDDLNENIYVNKNLDAELQKMSATQSRNRGAIMQASTALRQQWQEAQTARQKTDELAQSAQDAANAAKTEADAENQLYDAIHKSTDAGFAYEQANIDLKKAQDDVTKGTGDATENNLRLREAYVKVADAAVAQAEANAEASGSTLSAGEKADIYRQKLQDLAAGLDPNSPLRKELQAYINQLNSIPSAKNTTIGFNTARIVTPSGSTKTAGGTKSFGGGGMIPGPVGAAVPATVHGGEGVFTQEQMKALANGGGDMSETNALLRQILSALATPPGGQTGIEAALYKVNHLANTNRARGMAGA